MRFKCFLFVTGFALLLGPALGLSQAPRQPGAPGRPQDPDGRREQNDRIRTGKPAPGVAPAAAAGPRWEYKVLTRDGIAELGGNEFLGGLNKLGDDGWELVTAPPMAGDGDFGAPRARFYFKRQKATAHRDGPPTRGQPAAEELQTRVLMLKHAQAPELAKMLTQLFARGGYPPALVADPRMNALIIRAPQKDVEELEQLAMRLDAPGAEEPGRRRTP
jgi:hypothetical protein